MWPTDNSSRAHFPKAKPVPQSAPAVASALNAQRRLTTRLLSILLLRSSPAPLCAHAGRSHAEDAAERGSEMRVARETDTQSNRAQRRAGVCQMVERGGDAQPGVVLVYR